MWNRRTLQILPSRFVSNRISRLTKQLRFKHHLRKILRFESLEPRRVCAITAYTNPLQRLNVSGDDGQFVSALDALIVINELNNHRLTLPGSSKLPTVATPPTQKLPYVDVTCDGFVSAIDALVVINALNNNKFPPSITLEAGSDSLKHLTSVDCKPEIREDSAYLTSLRAPITIPSGARTLRVFISNLQFDEASKNSIHDAFEIAIVDSNGRPLVLPFQSKRDALINFTESELTKAGPNVTATQGEIDIDLEHIPVGTKATLLLRLINNDSDTTSSVRLNGFEILTTSMGTSNSASYPSEPLLAPVEPVDFQFLQEVTNSFLPKYGQTSHQDDQSLLHTELAIVNTGTYTASSPVLVVVDQLSNSNVRVRQPDGFTSDGKPYFVLANRSGASSLVPGDQTVTRALSFINPDRAAFTYQLRVYSLINRNPAFTSSPVVEASVGKAYQYIATANDPDDSQLAFSLLSGPAGLTFSNGVLNWTPNAADKGSHNIAIQVSDGHGGSAVQSFSLSVINLPSNRPPIFTSVPVVDANIGTLYEYVPKVRDPDSDPITLGLANGPTGMKFDEDTGTLQWQPTSEYTTWNTAQDFSLRSNPTGPWSYGWTQDQGSEFHPYSHSIVQSGLAVWDEPAIMQAGAPSVAHNPSKNPISIIGILWKPNEVSFHPGGRGERSVIRWTAPVSGNMEITAQFANIDFASGATTDVHVLHNGVSVFDGSVIGHQGRSEMPSTTRFVKLGDTIDFIVGTGSGGFAFDSTSVNGTIKALAPPSWNVSQDFSGTRNPIGSWSYGWTESQGSAFKAFDQKANSNGLDTWDASAFTAVDSPKVSYNPTAGKISGDGGNLVWAPGQLTLRPGSLNQRGVVRWIAPAGGEVEINANFGFFDNGSGTSSDVHVLLNNRSLLDGLIDSSRRNVVLDSYKVQVDVGDTIDFVVGFGNGNSLSDTTSLDASIHLNHATRFPVSLVAKDDRGGQSVQDFIIDVQPAKQNHPPKIVSSAPTDAVYISPDVSNPPPAAFLPPKGFASQTIEILPASHTISGMALGPDEKLIFSNHAGPVYQKNLSTGTTSILKADNLFSPARMFVSNGGTYGEDLILADSNYQAGAGCCDGVVYRINRTTGSSSVLLTGTPGRTFGDPYSVALGKGDAFGTDLYVMDFQGTSSQTPILQRISAAGQVTKFAEGGPWTLDSTPSHIEFSPGGAFGEYLYVADSASKKIWRVNPDGQVVEFVTSETVSPVSIRFSAGATFGTYLYAMEQSGRIVRIESDGTVNPFVPAFANSCPTFACLNDMVFNASGEHLYVGVQNKIYDITAAPAESFTYEPQAVDPDADSLTYSLISAPKGMSVDRATGVVSWTPRAADLGQHTVQIEVSDSRGGFDLQEFQVSVANYLPAEIHGSVARQPSGIVASQVIYLDENLNGRRDLSEKFTHTDLLGNYDFVGLAPKTYEVRQQLGIDLRQTSPAGGGSHKVTLSEGEVRNNLNFTNESTGVARPNSAPQILTDLPTEVRVGEFLQFRVNAIDPDGDEVYFDSPVRPAGMGIQAGLGILVWTPDRSEIGEQDILVRVRDDFGGVALKSYHVNVLPPNLEPIIVSTPLGPATINRPYRYAVQALDADGGTLVYQLSGGKGNMQLNSQTGVLNWTPTASDVGSHVITITATDPQGASATQSATIEVTSIDDNRSPIVPGFFRSAARLGDPYFYSAASIDPDGDPIEYSLPLAPSGMTIDSAGLITWTPTGNQFGLNPLVLRISDGRGGVVVRNHTIVVRSESMNQPPTITTKPPSAATVDEVFQYDVDAIDPDGDAIAYSLAKAPDGMTIDPISGRIHWVPGSVNLGTQNIQVRALDTLGKSSSQNFDVTVRGINLPPLITSNARTTASAESNYLYSVTASDPEGGPLTYALPSSSGDMSIDANGVIRWKPSASEIGSHTITVQVRDKHGSAAEQTFTAVVEAARENLPPMVTSQPKLDAVRDTDYTYQVTASDPEGQPLFFQLIEFPNGMSIDSATGLIQWKPNASGIGRVTVVVTDLDGGDAEQSFLVEVAESNQPPIITSRPNTSAAVGATYGYDIQATDPDRDTLSYSLATAPAGMTIDPLGRVSWAPSNANTGSNLVRILVRDESGLFAMQEYQLDVISDTKAPVVRLSTESPVAVGEQLIVYVKATDNVGVSSLVLTVDGVAVPIDSNGRASLVMNRVGTFDVRAKAQDASGNESVQAVSVQVIDPSVTDAPEVDLLSPLDGANITTFTDLIGTVRDSHLTNWKIEAISISDGTAKLVGQGTTQISNSKLAVFDPTVLSNDSYVLRLTATNSGGKSSTSEVIVNVSGNLKLGNFTLAFTDLSVTVGNVPISIVRSYDSLLSTQSSELGYGWNLTFRDANLRTNLLPTGDEFGGLYSPFRDGTKVYVTLPGGKREGFTFRPKAVGLFDPHQRERDVPPETQSGNGMNMLYFVPSFVPDKGVTSKLSTRRSQLSKQGHEYFQFGGGIPYNPQDPSFGGRFQLTTKDGLIYTINAETGSITSVTDTLGNGLTMTGDGIASTAGTKITFERDLQNRITSVTDLAGKKVLYEYNTAGDLTSVTDREGNKTTFVYSSTRPHFLEKVVDPLNRTGMRTEFDAQGRMSKVLGNNGAASTMSYDSVRNIQTITNARGFTTTYQYDADGNVVSETDPLGNTTTRSVDSLGNVLSETDALGHTIKASFDNQGNVTSQTDALGNVVRYFYTTIDVPGFGPMTLRESDTDALGNTLLYKYDSQGKLISTSDAFGNKVITTYDEKGRPLTVEDSQGRKVTQTFDSAGNLTEFVDASGQRTNFTYNGNGMQTGQSTVITHNGRPELLSGFATLDSNDRPTAISGTVGRIADVTYDANGSVTNVKGATGANIGMQTDANGFPSGLTLPDGTTQSVSRDANGNVTVNKDREGRITTSEYDAADRLTAIMYPDGSVERSEYDAVGRLVAKIDANGNRTTMEYDANNVLIATTDALGNRISTTYDAKGQLVAETDANGNVTKYEYDGNGTPIRTLFADGTSQSYTYDAATNSRTFIDELGQKTVILYDVRGAITTVIDALGQRTNYTYNDRGKMLSMTDANGHITRWEYDLSGRLTLTTLPLGMAEANIFDGNGKLERTRKFNGNETQYFYDGLNQLQRVDANGALFLKYTLTPSGLTSKVEDSRGATLFTYDIVGRVTKVQQPDGTSIEYGYDRVGNRTSVKTPAGETKYTYDKVNRLTSVIDPQGNTTVYRYDPAGNLLETKLPNGLTESRTYDRRHRLISIQQTGPNGLVQSYTYTLDKAGRRILAVEGNGRQTAYRYDALGRLTKETITDLPGTTRTIDYTYDAVGNRLTRTDSSGGVTTYVYDANDRLLSETTGPKIVEYTYDANGNMRTRSSGPSDKIVADWNAMDELVGVDVTDATGTKHFVYQYDQDGNRVAESVDGVETKFLIDGQRQNGQILVEYNAAGSVLSSYTLGLQRISQDRNGVRRYYLHDGLGSARTLIDSTATVTDSYQYDAFGVMLQTTGTDSNRFLYAGEQFDSSIASYNLRARHYSPGSGRFLSQDPIASQFENSQTANRYLYALNDPVNRVDPSGMESLVSMLNVTAIRSMIIQQGLVNTVGMAVGGMFGLGTLATFFHPSRSKWPKDATAFIQGFSFSSEDLFGRFSAAVGIDQLIPLKNGIRFAKSNYPVALTLGFGVSFSLSPVPARLGATAKFLRGRAIHVGYEIHSGLAWNQGFPIDNVDKGTSVSWAGSGYSAARGLTGGGGGTIAVGIPASATSSYSFVLNASAASNTNIVFNRTLQVPIRLTVPSGLSSQIGVALYLGDLPSFEFIASPLGAVTFDAIVGILG